MRQRFRLLKSALATALCVTVLAAGFIFPVHVQAANAIRPSNVTEPGEGCKLYNYQGTFDTATKDEILTEINKIRKDACDRGVHITATGRTLKPSDYVPIKWSSALENMALLRSAETFGSYGTFRPNGDSDNSGASYGVPSDAEIMDTKTIMKSVSDWYDTQQRNWLINKNNEAINEYVSLIDPNNTYCGLASFNSVSGDHCIAEFSQTTKALDTTKLDVSGFIGQTVEVNTSTVTGFELYSYSEMIVGRTYPHASLMLVNEVDAKPYGSRYNHPVIENTNCWSSSDPSALTIDYLGNMTPKKAGTYTITYNGELGHYSKEITVRKPSISVATVMVDGSYTYDGTPKTPSLRVSFRNVLIPSTEYTVTCKNNINAGTATAIITPTEESEYGGTKEISFCIHCISLPKNIVQSVNNSDLAYTGQPQQLGSVTVSRDDAYVKYSLSQDYSSYTTDIPTATNTGRYCVYYKVCSNDPNCADNQPAAYYVNIVNSGSPTATATPTPIPTATPTPIPTATPTPIPTATPTPRPTATPTPRPTATPTPIPTATPTPRPTATPTPRPTATPTPRPTATPTPRPTATPTPRPTATPTPRPTATPTPRPTATPTPRPTATPTPIPTATATPTPIPTATPTPIPTATPTPRPTATPTPRPTATPTPRPTATPTSGVISTPTTKVTPSVTAAPTAVPTAVPTPSTRVYPGTRTNGLPGDYTGTYTLTGTAHVQDYGDREGTFNSTTGVLKLGSRGESKRMERICINFVNNTGYSGSMQYRVHVQNIGWMNWVDAGQVAGTTGQGLRLEGIEIRLTGELAQHYSVQYCAHIQDYGDNQGWVRDGALAGTTGESRRVEEINVMLVPFDVTESIGVEYRVHRQDYGWETDWAANGAESGTVGEGKRLEGIEIHLTGTQYSGGIEYRTHVQDYGWQNYVSNEEMSGTYGESKRLEGIEIELTGEIAQHYDVYYRVHCQDYGWLGWACNGQMSGTSGLSKRLEAIQVVLVPKGSGAPSDVYYGISANYSQCAIAG